MKISGRGLEMTRPGAIRSRSIRLGGRVRLRHRARMRNPPAAPDAAHPTLVVDDDGVTARRFRRTAGASGSAQFSAAGWQDIRRLLDDVAAEDLYAVDLRQESHGFLNGAAVSWYAADNWGCVGLRPDEAAALEALRLRLLDLGERVKIGRVESVKRGAPAVYEEWPRRSVRTEREVVALPEGHHVRLPVTDHLRPADEIVDQFIDLVRALPERAHLHFHCRGGKGRTAVFMALLDMLRSARSTPLDEILARQQRLNDYDLMKTPDPARAKAAYAPERKALLARFHEYARENPGGAPLRWSEWTIGRGA